MTDLQNELTDYGRDLGRLADRLPLSDTLIPRAIAQGRRPTAPGQPGGAGHRGPRSCGDGGRRGRTLWPHSDARRPGGGAADRPSTVTASSSATPPPAAPQLPNRSQVSANLMRLLAPYGPVAVRTLAPPSTTGKGTATPTAPATGLVDLTTAHGTVAIAATVTTTSRPRPGIGLFACPQGPGISCRSRVVGEDVVTEVSNPAGSPGAASVWMVSVGRTDGLVVQVDEWNGAQPKGTSDPRLGGTPALSVATLQAIAADRSW